MTWPANVRPSRVNGWTFIAAWPSSAGVYAPQRTHHMEEDRLLRAPALELPVRGGPKRLPPAWSAEKAATVLEEARHQLAAGGGMSDRTLGRMAALSDPDAAADRESFVDTLERVGWGDRRIARALVRVEGEPPRQLASQRGRASAAAVVAMSLVVSLDWAYDDYPIAIHLVAAIIWWPLLPASILLRWMARGGHTWVRTHYDVKRRGRE